MAGEPANLAIGKVRGGPRRCQEKAQSVTALGVGFVQRFNREGFDPFHSPYPWPRGFQAGSNGNDLGNSCYAGAWTPGLTD